MEERGSLAVDAERRRSLRPNGAGELRAGIIGAGFIGRVHARSARLTGAHIAGVAASSPERAAAAREELGAERGFASAEELIASDSVDVVHVCAPNHLHVPLARATLEAGKHLICEKPLALDSEAAAELVAEAERANRVATVPFAYRYYPTVREARARVRSGAAGEVRLLHGGYLQDWLLAAEDDNWRVDAEMGGASRAFADIGSHWCDLIEFVSGQRITSLTARVAIAHPERTHSDAHAFERGRPGGTKRAVETEDIATVLFETDGGAAGSVVVSQVSAGRKNHLWFEVSGTTQALGFDQEQPESLWVGTRDGSISVPRGFETLSPEAASYVTLPAGHPQGFHDCFDAFVAETYGAILGGRLPEGLPLLTDGRRAVQVTEAVLESSRSGSWTEVPRP
jgi:predicted dehydrogenase